MDTLYISYIYYLVYCFLDLKDIIKLMSVNKILYNLTKDEQIWRMRFFKRDLFLDSDLYFKYIRMFHLKNSRLICGVCEDYLITDLILIIHNCNYNLKKCINCEHNQCSCSNYVTYHKCCLKSYQNNSNYYSCPFCETIIPGYFIKYNI